MKFVFRRDVPKKEKESGYRQSVHSMTGGQARICKLYCMLLFFPLHILYFILTLCRFFTSHSNIHTTGINTETNEIALESL